MKTRSWILIFAAVAGACLAAGLLLRPAQSAATARITSHGQLIATVSLARDQELDIDGHNTVTVRDGKIAVTWADCPDHYCMERGFCSGGREIVCLPNALVISFVEDTGLDAVAG